MEDENWELNEKDTEFGKWIFGPLARYFLYLFMHYFLFIDYAGDFWRCVVTTFKKPLVKIVFIFMIVICLASVNEVELNGI